MQTSPKEQKIRSRGDRSAHYGEGAGPRGGDEAALARRREGRGLEGEPRAAGAAGRRERRACGG